MDPQITVIVPCYNEEKSVDKTIADLKKTLLTLGKTYEIIFVNDCSKDKTADKIAEHKDVILLSHKIKLLVRLAYPTASLRSKLRGIRRGEFIKC
ncbi:glycosyltransferase [Candidatus Woesearchaeota archaeon]|nr:glycosyltransferase [Candidatus Woesearchaeota archaeon]